MPVLNFLQNIEFRMTIERLPNTMFFLQKMSIPDISQNVAIQPTPRTPIKVNGDTASFSDLTLTFICDENLEAYIEIFNWITGLTAPEDDSQYKELRDSDNGLFSDMSIVVLSNEIRPIAEFVFHKCVPLSITGVELDRTVSDISYTTMTVTFAYDTFEIFTDGIK